MAPLKLLRTLAGHEDVTTTIATCGHLYSDSEDQAAMLLNAFFVPRVSSVTNGMTNEAPHSTENAV
ncbi:hypothetical protein OJ997_03640 [Solirubrobacter phytolaccae]|uniref:Uncharacterized protein n=1 Tax=Solirubrobacter phytolaccae TaxID=1404360 RepID=A0A9X3N6S9_9ACTN|nr:hypothetical protein [Solirubrobacter phytolaccae]MDA0179377.1 hypothetical protein [Solirubrobacter phytolaccae]